MIDIKAKIEQHERTIKYLKDERIKRMVICTERQPGMDPFESFIEKSLSDYLVTLRDEALNLVMEFQKNGSRELSADEKVVLAIASGVLPKCDFDGDKVILGVHGLLSVVWTGYAFQVAFKGDNHER